MRKNFWMRALAGGGALAVAGGVLYGCGSAPAADDRDVAQRADAIMKPSFKAHGQAKLDRLDQDETQRLCSEYAGQPLPQTVAHEIEQANLATIRYPADGKLIGDWKKGEAIAQNGTGFQYSDDPSNPAGANCYACHQLSPNELSYG